MPELLRPTQERAPQPRPHEQESEMVDLTHEAEISTGSLEAFDDVGLSLHPTLREMLLETVEHRFIPENARNNRRGSGFMQATRVLADVMQKSPKDRIAALFDIKALTELRQESLRQSGEFRKLLPEWQEALRLAWAKQHTAREAFDVARDKHTRFLEWKTRHIDIERVPWTAEHQALAKQVEERYTQAESAYEKEYYEVEYLYDEAFPSGLPEAYTRLDVRGRLGQAVASLTEEEDVLIGRMIHDLLVPYECGTVLPIPSQTEKGAYVGTCTTAETYFLSMLDADAFEYTAPIVIHDGAGEPLMIFKTVGEQSAITLQECVIDGVRIPAGSLIAPSLKKPLSEIKTIEDCTGFRFLRLTTLAISPEHRRRAFGPAMRFQEMNRMYQANTATIEQLRRYARGRSLRAHYS